MSQAWRAPYGVGSSRPPAGRTAVVTGATRGIGRAIAMKLADEGFRLALNYHGDDRSAAETLEAVRERCVDAILLKADVAVAGEASRLIRSARERFGSLDVLINNAGLNIDRPLLDMAEEDWDRVVDTNMKSVFLCSRAAARIMLDQQEGGCILNLGATTAIRGRRNGLNYCAAKAGVIAMTKCLALELAPIIRVNCLIPGLVDSEEAVERFQLGDPRERKARESDIPLGYVGSVEDVAEAARFLVSPAARYINGQKLIVDGGQYMY